MTLRDLTPAARTAGWFVPPGWCVLAHTERSPRDADGCTVQEMKAFAAGDWCWSVPVVRVVDSWRQVRARVEGIEAMEGSVPSAGWLDPLECLGQMIGDELDEACAQAAMRCSDPLRQGAAEPAKPLLAVVDRVHERVSGPAGVLAELITLGNADARHVPLRAVAMVGRTVYQMAVTGFTAVTHADTLQAYEAFSIAAGNGDGGLTAVWVQPATAADPRVPA